MGQRNPTNWVSTLFDRFLTDEVLARIVADYAGHRDVPLAQLGVDSMSVMGLVLTMQDAFDLNIDFVEFDIATLATLGSIEEYLVASGVLLARREQAT